MRSGHSRGTILLSLYCMKLYRYWVTVKSRRVNSINYSSHSLGKHACAISIKLVPNEENPLPDFHDLKNRSMAQQYLHLLYVSHNSQIVLQ